MSDIRMKIINQLQDTFHFVSRSVCRFAGHDWSEYAQIDDSFERKVCTRCGVGHVRTTGIDEERQKMAEKFADALERRR